MEAYKFSPLNVLVLSQGMFFVFVRIADYSDEEYRVFNQSTQFHFISMHDKLLVKHHVVSRQSHRPKQCVLHNQQWWQNEYADS